MARQSCMINDTKMENYSMRRLKKSTTSSNDLLPLLNKHLKGHAPTCKQYGITCNNFPTGLEQFIETKVILNGLVRCRRLDARDNTLGAAATCRFQCQVRKKYIDQLRLKNIVHFVTTKGTRGPLEVIFLLDCNPLVFGTFAEMSLEANDNIETAVEK